MGQAKRSISAFNIFLTSAILICVPFGSEALGSGIYMPKTHPATVTNVRVGKHSDKTRVVLDISHPTSLRYDTSADDQAVFIELPNVKWAASPFEPRHSKGKVLEFRYSPTKTGSLFNILTDGPVTVKRPFILKPAGRSGHRVVIDLIPKDRYSKMARYSKSADSLVRNANFSSIRSRDNTHGLVAGLQNIGESSEEPPAIEARFNNSGIRHYNKHPSNAKERQADIQVSQNRPVRPYEAQMFNNKAPRDLTHQSLYLKGLAGMTVLPEITNTGGGNENTMEFDPGFSATGAIGIGLNEEFRAEVELNYASNTLTQLQGTANGVTFGSTTFTENDLATFSVMGNVAYDFPKNGQFIPYVSGGAGVAGVLMNEVTANATQISDGADWVFAYQLGAGVSMPLDSTTTLEAGYRFFETQNPEFGDLRGSPFTTHFSSHNFMLGARLTY